jgi:beta-glucosidase
VTIQAAVRNTGSTYAGKEVLQVYLEKPAGRLDHEKQSLAAFAKTKLLAPGEATDLVMTFDLTEQASFDERTASWFLEKGEYGVTLGTSSRKNALCAVIVLDEEITTEKTVNICPMMRDFADLKSVIAPPSFDNAFPRFHVTAGDVTCLAQTYEKPGISINARVQEVMARLDDEELISLCVGAGYGGLSFNNTPGVAGRTAINLLKKGIPNINLSDGPAGLNVIQAIVILKNGSSRYIDGIPEDWNWGYLKKLEPFVKAKPGRGREVYQYMTAWPSATLQAQSLNVELLQEIGQAIGREMLEIGVTVWLAPGMNLHRNPLCGRNFEYYSEDPLISGKMAAAVTRGVQSQGGVGVSIKHMCCNNQEDNRDYVSSNLSERALRELYLQGYRIAIREGNPWTVMSSYNKVNGVYTPNSHDLMTMVLRNEWGFEGLVMSDWNSTDKCSHAKAINSGNDLIMPGNKRVRKELKKALESGELERDCLRTSAARVLTMIFNSAVAEGIDS